ncbi:hypothetical protein AN958_03560, partial [Leucoagaricus sp. SymC.cos]
LHFFCRNGRREGWRGFIVIVWAAGQRLRKKLELPPKHFYIILTAQDNHDIDEGKDFPPANLVDHLLDTLFHIAVEHMKAYIPSPEGFIRFAGAFFDLGSFKNAMLAYAQAYERFDGNAQLQGYCINMMAECSRQTEWTSVFQYNERDTVPSTLLLAPRYPALREILGDQSFYPRPCFGPKNTLSIPTGLNQYYQLPRFFRWIVPFQTVVVSTPTKDSPPSVEQMGIIIHPPQGNKNIPVLIYSLEGKGGAGTVIAYHLGPYGFKKPSFDKRWPTMDTSNAQQEAFVSEWCGVIKKRRSIYPNRPSEPSPCPMGVEGSINRAQSNLFILVCLPGSGKSWFSQALVIMDPQDWCKVSQDDIDSHLQGESAISRRTRPRFTILYRCNTSDVERFVALNIYDRSTSEFVNRASLEAMLRGTSIMLVPVIPELKHQLLSRAKPCLSDMMERWKELS